MWTAQQQEDRFAKCTADELIRIAETGKDLDGRELTTGVLSSLHGAWQCTFGEGLRRSFSIIIIMLKVFIGGLWLAALWHRQWRPLRGTTLNRAGADQP
jgi:hypothetical protein